MHKIIAYAYAIHLSKYTLLYLDSILYFTGKILPPLLKARAPTNTREYIQGDTPLHKSIMHQMNTNTLTLIKNGANPNIPNAAGETCIHKAAVHCSDISIWTALMKGQSRISLDVSKV